MASLLLSFHFPLAVQDKIGRVFIIIFSLLDPEKKVKHRMLFISVLATSPCIYSLLCGLVSNTFLSLLMSLPLYGIFFSLSRITINEGKKKNLLVRTLLVF